MNPRGLDGGFGASAASLTDLFETDALLDALGGRTDSTDRSHADALAQEPVLRLLSALADTVDDDLVLDTDPVVIAALAAGFELAASVEADADLDEDGLGSARSGRSASARTGRFGSRQHDTLQVVGGGAGRRLNRRRPYRLVAIVTGVALTFGGGGLAAAATTDPGHAWGPWKSMVRVLHPGWRADVFATKRAEIMRTLDQASQLSSAGQPVAAAVSFGTAREQARDLPKAPDAGLRERFAAVAAQLGLPPDTADPVGGTGPADPGHPTSYVSPPAPVELDNGPASGGSSGPVSGAAPGTLPPVQPDPSSTAGTTTGTTGAAAGSTTEGATGGSTASGSATGTDAGAATGSASPSPEPSPVPTDPSSGGSIDGSAPTGGTQSGDGATGSSGSTGNGGGSISGGIGGGSSGSAPSGAVGKGGDASSPSAPSGTDSAADSGSAAGAASGAAAAEGASAPADSTSSAGAAGSSDAGSSAGSASAAGAAGSASDSVAGAAADVTSPTA